MVFKLELKRVSTGIKNLDLILNGGLLPGSQTLLIGDPGAGKTILSGIFAEEGTRRNENVVYVCVEEKPTKIRGELKALKINLEDVIFIDATPTVESRTWYIKKEIPSEIYRTGIEYEFNPEGLIGFIKPLAEKKHIDRLIIDSFSSLLSLYESGSKARQAVTKLLNFFRELDVTALITMEKESRTSFLTPTTHLVDTVMYLSEQYGKRSLTVKKMRGSDYISGKHTFLISKTQGINVYPYFFPYMMMHSKNSVNDIKKNASESKASERKGFGVSWIDEMIRGGLSSGTTTLISGPTGTGKTFLSALFLIKGTEHGEKCLMLSMEDSLTRFRDMMNNHGFDIDYYLDNGLTFVEASPRELDINYLGYEFVRLLEEESYTRIVIDGFSPVEELLDEPTLNQFLYSVTNYVAKKGITSIFTVEIPELGVPSKITRKGISFYFDNVLLLTNDVSAGVLRRKFSIAKMRKTQFDPIIKTYEIDAKTLQLVDSDKKKSK